MTLSAVPQQSVKCAVWCCLYLFIRRPVCNKLHSLHCST